MVAIQSYCGGLQLLQHLLDMAEHKQTGRILECIKNSVLIADAVGIEGEDSYARTAAAEYN